MPGYGVMQSRGDVGLGGSTLGIKPLRRASSRREAIDALAHKNPCGSANTGGRFCHDKARISAYRPDMISDVKSG
jgi:hypothetical protein